MDEFSHGRYGQRRSPPMKRFIYAVKDSTSGFADTIEITSDVPSRYLAQINRVNKMRPLPALMAADMKVFCIGEVDDETLTITNYASPQFVGDFHESIEWLERNRADAKANPKPF
jgi:hypothetical protein